MINLTGMKPFADGDPRDATAMKVGDWSMHGDVILEMVDSLPKEFFSSNIEPNSALAYGEAHLHVHQLDGVQGVDFDLRINSAGERHLKIVNPTYLRHQEHQPMLLKEGIYKIGIQREYDPFSNMIRSVID
jgi:hypothetical protein